MKIYGATFGDFFRIGGANSPKRSENHEKTGKYPRGQPNRDEALAGAANRPLTGSLTQCDHCTAIPNDVNVVAASNFAPGLRFLVPNFL